MVPGFFRMIYLEFPRTNNWKLLSIVTFGQGRILGVFIKTVDTTT